jgi:methylated-DNA-[protein]-cysteine S-methyltransferase
MDSPVGRMIVVAENDAMTRLEFSGRPHARGIPEESSVGSLLLNEVKRQLETYFSGALSAFNLPLQLQGTPFQQRVWQALFDIPFGATSSYSCLAAQIGRPAAVRAVGAANGLNPISIIVPCHRLIGANGHLTGYAGGLVAKRWLLRHEGHKVEGDRVGRSDEGVDGWEDGG